MGTKHLLYVKHSGDADSHNHFGIAKLLKNCYFQQAHTLAILLSSGLQHPCLVSIHRKRDLNQNWRWQLVDTIQLDKGKHFEYGDFSLNLRVVQHLLANHVPRPKGHRHHNCCRSKAPFSETREEIQQAVACVNSSRLCCNFSFDGVPFNLRNDYRIIRKQNLHIWNLVCDLVHLFGSDFSVVHLRWLDQAQISIFRVQAKFVPLGFWHVSCARYKHNNKYNYSINHRESPG